MTSESPPHPASEHLRHHPAFHHIPFTPVPVRTRHDGWTPERQRGFIDRLVLTGSVARSAKAVGKTPQSAYRLREHAGAASFRAAWERALRDGQSYQIDIGIERALDGEVVPITYRGRVIAERRRYDNRLAMAVFTAMNGRTEKQRFSR